MTIGVDGLPVVAYYDDSNHVLDVAHCEDLTCESRTIHTVDATGNVGQFASIAIDLNGNPDISYYDVGNGNLKIAYCADVACASATVQTVDATNNVGQFGSMALFDVAYISYYDATAHDLKLASCNSSTTCTSPTVVTIASGGDVGKFSSLVFGPTTVSSSFGPVIAFYDATNNLIKIAYCNGVNSLNPCNSPVIKTLFTASAANPVVAMALGLTKERFPYVAHVRFDGTVTSNAVTLCVDTACSAAPVTKTLISGVSTSTVSTALGADGFPVIASGLHVFRCLSSDCSNFPKFSPRRIPAARGKASRSARTACRLSP